MKVEEELDRIYDLIGDLLDDHKFEEVDEILKNVDVENTELVYLAAYLVNTNHVKYLLKNRFDFLKRIIKKYPESSDYVFCGLD